MPSTGYVADTFIAGEQPTTAKWNELWGNDASFNSGNGFNDNIIVTRHFATSGLQLPDKMLNPYKFSVYRNASQTITSTSTQKIAFDSKTYDTSGNFDVVTNNRFVATLAGFYHFSASVALGTAGTNTNGVFLYKNGSEVKRGMYLITSALNETVFVVSGDLQLAVNDFVEVYIANGSGVGCGLGTGSNKTYFDGHLVSAT